MADQTYDQWSEATFGGGRTYTPEQQQQMQRMYTSYQQRQQGMRQIDSLSQAQENFYPTISKSYMAAVRPGMEDQYKTASRQGALGDIQRGVYKGSQGVQRQAGLAGAFQTRLGQAQMQGDSMAAAKKAQDEQAAQTARMSLQNPYESYGLQSQLGYMGAQGQDAYRNMQMSIQSNQNQQAIQNMWSQLYGGQLSTVGNALSMYGGMGGGR